jgi:uncharacterized protein (TIGR03437 family)
MEFSGGLWSAGFRGTNGIAVGGVVDTTSDGGETWKEQPAPRGKCELQSAEEGWGPAISCHLRAVSLWDRNIATAVGLSGTIIRTEDGGVNWRQLPAETYLELRGVVFTSPVEGWIATDGILLHTSNGGESYSIRSSATGLERIAPSSRATIIGQVLTAPSATADSPADSGTSLAGIKLVVTDKYVKGYLAPLLSVSESRIDFVVPLIPVGFAYVRVDGAPMTIPLLPIITQATAPGVFTLPGNIAAAYGVREEADGSQTQLSPGSRIVLDDRPVTLVVYGTGIRYVDYNISATIGGNRVPIDYSGPAPGSCRARPGEPLSLAHARQRE